MTKATATKIHTSSQMQDILPHLSEETLLVLDLDETVITSTTYHGSIEWAEDLIKKLIKEGLTEEEAIPNAVEVWAKAQEDITMQLTEDAVTAVIAKSSQYIACTKRSKHLYDTTLRHLNSVGVTFGYEGLSYPIVGHEQAYFHHGVIFCGDDSKGSALFSFLKESPLPPHIVMVDDTFIHLEDTAAVCHQHGVEFTGFHYNRKI
jgi:hypothetical protein